MPTNPATRKYRPAQPCHERAGCASASRWSGARRRSLVDHDDSEILRHPPAGSAPMMDAAPSASRVSLFLRFAGRAAGHPEVSPGTRDVTEAKGRIDWVHARLCQDPEKADIHVVVVAPTPALHQVALPFAGGLFYLAPDSILKLAERIVESIRKLRVKFSGREFAEAAVEFSAALRHMGLHLESAKKVLLTEHLKK